MPNQPHLIDPTAAQPTLSAEQKAHYRERLR